MRRTHLNPDESRAPDRAVQVTHTHTLSFVLMRPEKKPVGWRAALLSQMDRPAGSVLYLHAKHCGRWVETG